MEPVPIPLVAKEWYPHMKEMQVGKPGYDGTNDGDGSSVQEAFTLWAQYGVDPENGWPHFREYWEVTKDDFAHLREGGLMMLTFWVPQMPVHSLQVLPNMKSD